MTDPLDLIVRQRKITGMSAVFLPFTSRGDIDWEGFERHLDRTLAAGLIPAVNMDTGSIQFLDETDRRQVLDLTRAQTGNFVAGACVRDRAGDALNLDAYRKSVGEITERNGTPVVFPCWGLNALEDAAWLDALDAIARDAPRFIGFELGPQFVPYGRIVSLETYAGMMSMENCIGAKHSSLDRSLEWQRLELRNARRPGFMVLTGNDLAIDMVMYGSDYLLGLSSFAPEAFARRDRYWAEGDRAFHSLNDLLQYLGQLVFRSPTPSYKHSAAQFLSLDGTLAEATCPPGIDPRPDSDLPLLEEIRARLAGS
ncbi:MAG: dihydrodipicolinate synthase family protein [Pseudomonadales bacterium]|nr:dihydrodipicolinate synthase family protein [Pseudomonadales bacterium]